MTRRLDTVTISGRRGRDPESPDPPAGHSVTTVAAAEEGVTTRAGIAHLVSRHPLVAFVVLTYVLSWGAWLLYGLSLLWTRQCRHGSGRGSRPPGRC